MPYIFYDFQLLHQFKSELTSPWLMWFCIHFQLCTINFISFVLYCFSLHSLYRIHFIISLESIKSVSVCEITFFLKFQVVWIDIQTSFFYFFLESNFFWTVYFSGQFIFIDSFIFLDSLCPWQLYRSGQLNFFGTPKRRE